MPSSRTRLCIVLSSTQVLALEPSSQHRSKRCRLFLTSWIYVALYADARPPSSLTRALHRSRPRRLPCPHDQPPRASDDTGEDLEDDVVNGEARAWIPRAAVALLAFAARVPASEVFLSRSRSLVLTSLLQPASYVHTPVSAQSSSVPTPPSYPASPHPRGVSLRLACSTLFSPSVYTPSLDSISCPPLESSTTFPAPVSVQ